MDRIDCGAASAVFDFAEDGMVDARFTGLVVPANAGSLSGLLLSAGVERGAKGVLCSVEKALLALPPIDPRHYGYVPPALRSVPVAVVVHPEQLAVYEEIVQAAAVSGTIRRAFLSRAEAQEWLREQARALAANRVWRPRGHRSSP